MTGSHTYATAGQFTITTFMNDDGPDAAVGVATTTAAIGFGGDGVPQEVTELTSSGTLTIAIFSDNTSLPASDYVATIDWGDGTTTAGTVSGSSGSYSVTGSHTYAEEGNFTSTTTVTRTTDNAHAIMSGPVTVDEGDVLNGSGVTINGDLALSNVTVATFTDVLTANVASDFVATIDWGDGTTTAGTISGSGGAFSINGSHSYAQGGQYTILANMKDDPPGFEESTATSTANVGLFNGVGATISATEGTASAGTTATFTDGDTADTTAAFSANIDWGDGTTTAATVTGSNGSFSVQGGHTYADEGNFTTTTSVTRTADNSQLTIAGSVTAADADVLTLAPNSFVANPGQAFNGQVATFSDVFTGNTASDFIATINWGDGTTTAGTITGSGAAFTVSGTHTYTSGGSFSVTTTASDDAPGTATATGTGTATVNFAGTMTLTTATEHVALSNATIATFNDGTAGDQASGFSAAINWGDGTTSAGTVTGGPGPGTFTIQGSHTYSDEGNDQATVTLTRTADQAQSTIGGSIAVAEHDSLTAQPVAISGRAQQALTDVTVATFTDTDTVTPASDFVATINWGDGTTTAGSVSGSNGTFTVTGSHTYATSGQDNVTVTVADDAPGTATATATSTASIAPASDNAPVFAHFGAAHTSATEQTFTLLNAAATVSDVELDAANGGAGNYAGASLIIGRTGAANTEDTFGFGGAGMTFTVDTVNHVLLSGGQQFATYNIPSSGSLAGTIAVNFNSLNTPATTALVNNVLQHITYENLSDTPPASVTMHYTFNDGNVGAQGTGGNGSDTANRVVDITAVNDAPVVAGSVTLVAIAEDSGARLITQAQLLGNASDVDGPSLAAVNLAIATGGGSLVNNNNGTWSYTPALNDDTSVSFSYQVTDGTTPVADSATLDITPVNDAPVVSGSVTLAAIAEDSGARLITQAQLLGNASDVDGPSLAAVNLAIATGGGSLVNNNNGTWSYTPALNDDTSVSFTYQVTDGTTPVADSATLDIAPVNDAPVVAGSVTLAPIAEGSGAHLITQAQLLGNASDVDGPSLTAINLAIATGAGTLVDNHNGTWSYTPAPNDGTSVSFAYQVTDGVAAPVADSASLDITQPHWMASADLGVHPAGPLPSAIGDFVQDGTSDILWYNAATLGVDVWKMSNGQWAGSVDLSKHPAGWQLGTTGDFNGDGTSDVLWYNPTSGNVDIWKISNGQWAGSVDAGAHSVSWLPVASGDFNHDGISDVLWYNSTSGDVDIWKMSNSGQWAGSVDAGTHPAGWQPAGVGDFNGDGTSDILWYNPTTHDAELWKISNGQWAGSVDLGTHAAGWAPAGVGDFNADGTGDVLWFNAATGDAEVWLISNGQWSGSVDLGTHSAGWTLAGVGDFNHDATSDILWRETATGHTETWLLAH